MEVLEVLKNEAEEIKVIINEVNGKRQQFAQKRDEVEAMKNDITKKLSELRKGHNRAVELFARNEVNASELDKFPAKIAELEARLKSLDSVLEIIASDTAAAITANQEAAQRLGKITQRIWDEITQKELAAAAPFLRRAFAAAMQNLNYMNRPTAVEFLQKNAHDVAFIKQKDVQPAELKEKYQF